MQIIPEEIRIELERADVAELREVETILVEVLAYARARLLYETNLVKATKAKKQ